MVWVLLDKTLPGSSSLIEMVWSSGPFLSCLRLQKKKKGQKDVLYIFSTLSSSCIFLLLKFSPWNFVEGNAAVCFPIAIP